MNKTKKIKVARTVFYFLIFFVGVYPLMYLLVDKPIGLLASKSSDIINSTIWKFLFYTHMISGSIALLSGSTQFLKKNREKNTSIHRFFGKLYISAVVCSGLAGFYLALFATDGIIAKIGFALLAILWLITTLMAYSAIMKREVQVHQLWMIRSYALCCAAITLRMWLPLLVNLIGLPFIGTYRYIAWLCWLPNLVLAEMIIRKIKQK